MNAKGFTLIELMIVVLILGLVAAIALPNYHRSQDRAREAMTKANMHTFQLAAEDFRVRSETGYATDAADVAPLLSTDFPNPFDRARGANAAWEDRSSMSGPPTPHPGIVSYADSGAGSDYTIKAYGRARTLGIVLTGTLPDYLNAPPPEAVDRRRRRDDIAMPMPPGPIREPIAVEP